MTQKQNSEEWEKSDQFKFLCGMICGLCTAEEHYDCPRVERLSTFIKDLLQRTREEVLREEYQFFKNILDGYDIANKGIGVGEAGTKSIRFALQSRLAGYGISLTPPTTTDNMSEQA